ncbi:phospho-N-acetylmuramoyl-pentapeptide-transferase [Thermoproteota archaeon]
MSALWCLLLTLCFAGIGIVDDSFSLCNKKNKGLKAWHKFLAQMALGVILLMLFHFGIRPLSIWMSLLFIFIIVAGPNATNLTDGLDGLLAGSSIISLIGFMLFLNWTGFHDPAKLCLIMIIGLGWFLIFNFKPAKIYMGDTGSLAIGALMAGLCISAGNPWIIIPFGMIYILETLSVIIQVIYFKFTGIRVFLMAPIHHHLELMGFSELHTVYLLWGAGAAFSMLGLIGFVILQWL